MNVEDLLKDIKSEHACEVITTAKDETEKLLSVLDNRTVRERLNRNRIGVYEGTS